MTRSTPPPLVPPVEESKGQAHRALVERDRSERQEPQVTEDRIGVHAPRIGRTSRRLRRNSSTGVQS